MTLHSTKTIEAIRSAILTAEFAPATSDELLHIADANGITDPVCTVFSTRISDDLTLCQLLDAYTSGNNSIVVSSQPDSDSQIVLMPADVEQELRANLRSKTRRKFESLADLQDSRKR